MEKKLNSLILELNTGWEPAKSAMLNLEVSMLVIPVDILENATAKIVMVMARDCRSMKIISRWCAFRGTGRLNFVTGFLSEPE